MTTLSDIVSTVADKTGSTKKDVEAILKAGFEVIKEEVATGSEVSVQDFGKFTVSERAAREGRNPATGASIQIDASKSVKFKTAKKFKDTL